MLDEATIIVLGKRAMDAVSEDLVEWATVQLLADRNIPAVRMLAGSSAPFYWSELNPLFGRALAELGFDAPEPETALRQWARLLAQQLVEGRIEADEGCSALNSIYLALDYCRDLEIWGRLDDAREALVEGYEIYGYTTTPGGQDLTMENFADAVKEEARRFLDETD